MRVLLVKTSSLGDVIHALPALTDAARAIPGIRFDWVVEEGFAEIPSWHPAVDKVIPVAVRRWRKNLWQTFKSGEWKRFKQSLRANQYDLVIDAQGLVKSAFLTRYAKGPIAGLDKHSAWPAVSIPGVWPLPGVSMRSSGCASCSRLPCATICPRGWAIMGSTSSAWWSCHAKIRSCCFSTVPPGTPSTGRKAIGGSWPSVWGQLGVEVRLPWGNPAEKARAERIARGLRNAVVLPKLNLAGVAKVLAGASACVAVDTGLGHLAAALDVPTVSLFGPTNPGLTGAYGKSQIHLASNFPCAPCLQKKCTYVPTTEDQQRFDLKREWPLCFTRLNPERVASRLSALLLAEERH